MAILNMITSGGGGNNVGEPTIIDVSTSGTTATITWVDNDLNTIPPSAFAKSVLVRKIGSAPTSPSDGTVVVTETTKNTYSNNGYSDTGLTRNTDYYYRVFTYSDTGGISYSDSIKTVWRTKFTISWTEKSDMSSGWTYSDNAALLTAGSTAFDEFFGYSAVRLNSSGVETAEVTQTTPGQLNLSGLGTLTSGDNVMIKFPLRGIKMTKSGSVITLSITDEPNKDGYQYYAFNDNGVTKDKLYVGAFMGSVASSKLVSLSGKTPGGQSLDSAVSAANAYGNTHYHVETFYVRQLINAYYIMKYGNPNSKSVIGLGYTSGSSPQTTGVTNNIINATGATSTSNTGRIKLFGLEDRWGNVCENLDGALGWSVSTTQSFPASGRITSFDKVLNTDGGGWISSIMGDNDGMFRCSINGNSGSQTTYYCDQASISHGMCPLAGGSYETYGGTFGLIGWYVATGYEGVGARLIYI